MFKELEAPTRMPMLPSIEELKASGDAAVRFDQWVAQCDEIEKLNDVLFEKSLKRIRLCTFLKSFLDQPLDTHYSWCPHEKWDAYWKESGWPELPQIHIS